MRLTRSKNLVSLALRGCLVVAVSLNPAFGRPGQLKAKSSAKPVEYVAKLDTIRAKISKWGLPEMSKTPNQYLTDFWGVQRLSDRLKPAEVTRALVPKYAKVASATDDPVLRLQFSDGWKADFYFNAILSIDKPVADPGQVSQYFTFVAVENADSVENEAEYLKKFWDILKRENLLAKFLKQNPYYQEELVADEALRSKEAGSSVKELGGFDQFKNEKNAYYLVPDAVHGDEARYQVLVDLLKTNEYEWLAIEMLPIDLQPALQVYVKAKADTAALREAEQKLLDFYRYGWNGRFGGKMEAPEENHYFRLLKMARENGKGAYALDAVADYIFFRYNEFPLGATTRNVLWVSQLPRRGRGIIFGGSAHMVIGQKGTFQYFLRKSDPNAVVYHYYVDHPPQKK